MSWKHDDNTGRQLYFIRVEAGMSIFSKNVRIPVFMLAVVLTLLIAHFTTKSHETDTCAYSLCKRNKMSTEELQERIQVHAGWLLAYKNIYESDKALNDVRRITLSGADLSNADLKGADLRSAKLIKANLGGADLSNAKLGGADLSGAELWNADLSGADLEGANLSNAKLNGADLSNARLYWGADLSGTDLRDADLNGVVFEPTTPPKTAYIAFARNLEKMVYDSTPQELIKLRKAFRECGFYGQERKITYAIKHCERKKALLSGKYDLAAFESVFNLIFFECTTQWGLSPWQSLKFLLYLSLIFMIPYAIALSHPGEYGIYRKWSDESMMTDTETSESVKLHVDFRRAVCLGLLFSMLSAFSIGWRELNVGNWIQRIQPKDYSLRATGWVRTVSGVQSLISVYLLAIWALTFFGQPFE
jgi:hypothetical protein